MEITTANPQDLSEIIDLLKSSLGEGLLPKSEAYFLWKHYHNPFGYSKILLARENGKIIGIRAFMRWKWISSSQEVDVVRAVDTATDPAFQGKGIFKKLTLMAVEECRLENTAFVFNTPNNISIQGYLKMGWFTNGKMPMLIGLGSLMPKFFNQDYLTKKNAQYDTAIAFSSLTDSWKIKPSSEFFHTPIDKRYLQWRYNDCPIVKYGAVIEPGKFGIVFRLKKLNRFIELRICEIWTEQENTNSFAEKSLKKLISDIKPAIVTCALSPLYAGGKKKLPGLWGPFKKGPIITLRPLAMEKLNNFEGYSNWRPSMGSMELF